MFVRRMSDPDYKPAYALQMLPVTHFPVETWFRDSQRVSLLWVTMGHETDKMRDRLSILVYIKNRSFYLMSCRKSNISPKYKSRKNEAEKEADYF